MEKEPFNIGSVGPDQDPNEIVRKKTGTYDDPASRLSEAQRFPIGPMANPKSPFKGATGG